MAGWEPRLDLSSKERVVLATDRCIMINLCDLPLPMRPTPAKSERGISSISSKPSFCISWHRRHPGFRQQDFKGWGQWQMLVLGVLWQSLSVRVRGEMCCSPKLLKFLFVCLFLLHILHIILCYMAAKQSPFNIYLLKMRLAGFERARGKKDEINGKSRN